MQFSTAQAPKTTWQRLSAQPHRLFFATSILWGITLMTLSMASWIGLAIDFSTVHGIGMLYGVFINAFLGFLSTVIPRYTQSIEIPKKLYHFFWLLYQVGLIVWFIGFSLAGQLLSGAALMIAGFVYYQTIRVGRYPDEPDSLWLVGLVFISGLLPVLNLFLSFSLSWAGIWVSVLPITFTVAQRMIPFFYAGYFRNTYSKPAWVVPFFVLGSWGIALGGDSSVLTSMLSFILSSGIAYFLWTLDIYKKAPAILWILALGFLWLPVGLFVTGLESLSGLYALKMGIHILLLGFVFTLLVGFGTRVLLGHSGQMVTADRITVYLFGAVQTAVVLRIIASLFFIGDIGAYVGILHLGFSLFVIVMLVWGIKYRKAIF